MFDEGAEGTPLPPAQKTGDHPICTCRPLLRNKWFGPLFMITSQRRQIYITLGQFCVRAPLRSMKASGNLTRPTATECAPTARCCCFFFGGRKVGHMATGKAANMAVGLVVIPRMARNPGGSKPGDSSRDGCVCFFRFPSSLARLCTGNGFVSPCFPLKASQ